MKPNPNMLRLARQIRGLKQTEAAKKLEIEQALLSRIENSVAEFREDLLMRAAIVLDFPKSFFLQTDPVYGAPVSVHPMWRRKAEVSVHEMDSVIAELNLRVMHLRRLLESADIAFTRQLPRFDIEEYGSPQKIAALVRATWKIPRGPMNDLTLAIEKSGVLVLHSPLGESSISGVTFATPGLHPLIVLNSDQAADRMRFTLAHELGHLVMHKFPTPSMEEEANAFASALLLPSTDIKPYFTGRYIDLSVLASLKPEWKVSMSALLMAASDLVPLTANQKQYLWKQMSAKGYRLREPPELDFTREQPTVIPNLIKTHVDGLGYSLEELLQLLNINERDFNYYYNKQGFKGFGITALEKPQKVKLTIVK